MTLKHARSSAAIIALVAALGGAALAQESQPAAPAQSPATAPAEAGAPLPDLIRNLGLEDLETQPSRHGWRVEGNLPGGGEIEAFLDPEGKPMMIEVDDAEMPDSLREAMLPAQLRGDAILSQFAKIEKIGTRDGFVMVGGEDADGKDLRAGFDPDGRLMRFGRGDDRPRGPHGMSGWQGRGDHHDDDHGHGDHGRDDRGPGTHGRDDQSRWGPDRGFQGRGDAPWMGGPQMGRPGMHGGQGMRPGMMPPPPIDPAAISKTLETAGYSQIEAPRPAGPRMLLDAVNPAGETVTIEVDPAGEVVREQAR